MDWISHPNLTTFNCPHAVMVGTNTCACLLSTTWLPGFNNTSPWWHHYRHKQEAGSVGRCPAELSTQVSKTKVSPGWNEKGRWRLRQPEDLFLCLLWSLPSSVIPPCCPPPPPLSSSHFLRPCPALSPHSFCLVGILHHPPPSLLPLWVTFLFSLLFYQHLLFITYLNGIHLETNKRKRRKRFPWFPLSFRLRGG